MRLEKALLVTKKDWEEVFQSKVTLLSVILPLIIPLAIPAILIEVFKYSGGTFKKFVSVEELDTIRRVLQGVEGMNPNQLFIYIICVLFIPLLFIIFSLASISMVTADSFAGEKERKTIEALLASPLTDLELFIGKLFASYIPSIALTYIFFIITVVVVNVSTIDIFGHIWYPPLVVDIAVFLIAPLYAFLGMTLVIWGSSRVSTVRDASNFAGILIIPVLIFIISIMVGTIVINYLYLLLVAIILFLLDIAAFYISYKTFDRERLITSI